MIAVLAVHLTMRNLRLLLTLCLAFHCKGIIPKSLSEMLMQQAFAIAYVCFWFIEALLFGWAMMLCVAIVPGFALGWRLQLANASIRAYLWSAEALLLLFFAIFMVTETVFVEHWFGNMIRQPQALVWLLIYAHVLGLVPVRISMWLGWRVSAKLKGPSR